MRLKWSPLAVNDKLDDARAEAEKIVAPLEAAAASIQAARAAPGLPDYMKHALTNLEYSLSSTARILESRISSCHTPLPKEVLAKEKHTRELERRLEAS